MEPDVVERYTVGLDWSDREHELCVYDALNKKTIGFTVAHDPKGMAALLERLPCSCDVLGIAIETQNNLVVQHLLEAGYTIYPVNPKLVKNWRDSVKAQSSKSDRIDAEAMAIGLFHYHDQLRSFKPADSHTRELAILCKDEMNLIGSRTALVNQLRATLKQYYPQALDFFTDWVSPAAWRFLVKYPNPDVFLRASRKGLIAFLKRNRIRYGDKWETRIENRKQAKWQIDAAVGSAKEPLAVALSKQLLGLQESLDLYRGRIEKLFESHPDCGLYESLPGAGEKLAPRLLSCMGADRDRFDSANGPKELSGVAPVSKQTGGSGKKPVVTFRFAANWEFRVTMHQFSDCSRRSSPWAEAFYRMKKAQGDDHNLALRKLGEKWLKIIYRMWKTGERYDEARYLNALIKHGSPLIEYMKQAA